MNTELIREIMKVHIKQLKKGNRAENIDLDHVYWSCIDQTKN